MLTKNKLDLKSFFQTCLIFESKAYVKPNLVVHLNVPNSMSGKVQHLDQKIL